MSVEFDELTKARENPSEEMASKYSSYSKSIIFNMFMV